jgi:hypothetical protein
VIAMSIENPELKEEADRILKAVDYAVSIDSIMNSKEFITCMKNMDDTRDAIMLKVLKG